MFVPIIEHYQAMIEALEDREVAEVIYFDFAKVFEKKLTMEC